ncbi:HNH endonuclease [Dyella sp. C9]|uniref:HNH endonuclease n=1 Tax=Dyella sp. C9 TaxID=2202154 RepID=UPI000DEFF9CB|nr:HNH endonuclease [Dyella sp. C9]
MQQLYIFTAGIEEARQHLEISVKNTLSWSLLDENLPPNEAELIKKMLPEGHGFYAWGATPGEKNKPNWESMQVGDVVLTVFGNHYRFVSSVAAKIHNAKLARAIWGTEGKTDKTWEYMYFLTEPRALSVAVQTKPVVDFLDKQYFGFKKFTQDKLLAIRKAYGSLDNFVLKNFNYVRPKTSLSLSLEGIERQARSAPQFESTSIVDGRKKVLAQVVRRQGQPKFRENLLIAYEGKCVVTECNIQPLLEAAHIIPFQGPATNHVCNGLLLRADIHTLFDLGLLKIDRSGTIHLADVLENSPYWTYQAKKIRLPSDPGDVPDPAALAMKFDLDL